MNSYLRRALDAVDAAAGPLTADEMIARAEGKWSPSEILEHLAIAYAGTTKGLERRLESAGRPVGRQSARQRLATLVVVHLGYFPAGVQAPAGTHPRGMPPDAALAAARDSLVAMDRVLDRANERFGRTKVLEHPILGALTCREWRRFHWVHTRHHMKQIERLRRGRRV